MCGTRWQELVIAADRFRQTALGPEFFFEVLTQTFIARVAVHHNAQGGPGCDGSAQARLALVNEAVDIGEVRLGLRVVSRRRLAAEEKGAGDFSFPKTELRSQEQAVWIVRIDGERLVEGLFRLIELAVGREQLGMAAPRLRVLGMPGGHLRHHAQGGFVLSLLLLFEGAFDLAVDRLAAPLELLAAPA